MCKLVILLLLIVNAMIMAIPERKITGYYWKDFHRGVLPKGAVAGGLDKTGQPIYICQTSVEDQLVPGKIYAGDAKCYFVYYAKGESTTTNAKILCSEHPENFQWIPTKSDELLNRVPIRLLVKGGWHTNGDYTTYIARMYSSGETTVGKINCQIHKNTCYPLMYSTNETKTTTSEVFDVLIYNPISMDLWNANQTEF